MTYGTVTKLGDPVLPVPNRMLALSFSPGRVWPQDSSACRGWEGKETPNRIVPRDAAKDRLSFL